MIQYNHMNDKVEEPAVARPRTAQIIAILITVIVLVLAVFFGAQLIFRIGLFHQPGQVTFSDSATEANRDFVTSSLTDLELEHDVLVSTLTTNERSDADNRVLYNILVPVTDFYNPVNSVDLAAAQQGTLLSIWELTNQVKLLAIDDHYFLDDFASGAFFEYYTVEGESATDVTQVVDLLRSKIAAFPGQSSVLTLAQTGVTALSRRMNAKLDQVQDATFFTKNIADYLSHFDLTHTSNESSFSQYANATNICSKPQMIDVLTSIGLDIVELTGNHNQDCGDDDAIATIQQYHNLGIRTVGGGQTAEEAAVPLEISAKNTNITFLAYNLSTGGYTLDNTPGANFYTEEKARADIAAAKARGDFIIVDIQYYECNEYNETYEATYCDRADSSAGDQVGFFRSLIDMGANIVVGTAAHQPQTYELYHDGAIYYGLGNLFFDQSWWPGTTRSLILVHHFYNGLLLQTQIVPTVYDHSYQTRLMDSAAAEAFINRLNQVRPAQQ